MRGVDDKEEWIEIENSQDDMLQVCPSHLKEPGQGIGGRGR